MHRKQRYYHISSHKRPQPRILLHQYMLVTCRFCVASVRRILFCFGVLSSLYVQNNRLLNYNLHFFCHYFYSRGRNQHAFFFSKFFSPFVPFQIPFFALKKYDFFLNSVPCSFHWYFVTFYVDFLRWSSVQTSLLTNFLLYKLYIFLIKTTRFQC